jgi:ATP-dependent helicase/nuclease subunit A
VNAPRRDPRDQAARTRAASDFTTNLVVSAGAGTGKTTLLVDRILNAIGSGAAGLPEIAAMTFTDKAAGELRHRLASGLRHVQQNSPESGARERAAEAEAALDAATVTTIHGFCSEILRAHPLAAGLPPGFAVDDGLAGRRFSAEEWSAFAEDELGPQGRRSALWARLLRDFDLAALADIGRVLACGAISETVLNENPTAFDLRAVVGPAAERLAEAIRASVDDTEGLTEAPRAWLLDAARVLGTFAAEGLPASQAVLSTSPKLTKPMSPVRTKKVAESDAEALEALEARARPFLKGLAAFNPRTEADLFEALLPFARRLRARQKRVGLVDFDGLLVRTRDLLRDNVAVRAAVKRRFRMILVDEFQDTDPIQYEIVLFLAERLDDRATDAYATRLEPGRLFIVGDAKQSIYRFRGADYSAYRRAVQHVLSQGGEELTLSSNFRSTPSVLHSVNALFEEPGSSLWRSSDYLAPYVPIGAERDGDGGAAVEVWTTTAGARATAAERRVAEGLVLANEIRALAGPGSGFRYDDVLLLFRGFSDLPPYLRALRAARIPFAVGGGRTFFERTEIIQAMAVLRAVADPADPIALLAYRRSPAGGVPDTELHAEAVGAGTPRPALSAADARLQRLRAEAAILPVDTAVRRVLEDSGLLSLSGLAFEGAQRVANLEKLQAAAAEFARDGRTTLQETLDALEDRFESNDEGDSPLADEGRDAVRVMTIHRAKGLEAPIVILADTAAGRNDRLPKEPAARMARFDHGEFVHLDGPAFRNGAAIASGLDDHLHRAAEDVRLLYVAVTRARDRLIVFGADKGNTPWIEAISAWKTGVTHRVLDVTPQAQLADAPPPVGAPDAVARYDDAAGAVLALAAPPFRSPSDSGEGGEVLRAIEGAPERSIAREAGRVVHARLAGFEAAATGEAADEAAAIVRAFEGSGLAARLAAADVLGHEVPVLFDEDGARWSGTIDLLYRAGDGAIVVADFKTDSSDDGAIERHGHQLRVYARAISRAMPGSRVRAELWMLRSGRVISLE